MQLDVREGPVAPRTTLTETPIDGGVRLSWRVHRTSDVVGWLLLTLTTLAAIPLFLLPRFVEHQSLFGLGWAYAALSALALALAVYRTRQRVEIDVTHAGVAIREQPFARLRPPPRRDPPDDAARVRVLLIEDDHALLVPIRVHGRYDADHVVQQVRDAARRVRGGRRGYRG